MRFLSLPILADSAQQQVLNDVFPYLVVAPQVDADDDTGDEDDGGAADHALPRRPLDFLQFGDRLLGEADAGNAGTGLVAALAARLGRLRARLLLCRRARPGWPKRRSPRGLRAALAALL